MTGRSDRREQAGEARERGGDRKGSRQRAADRSHREEITGEWRWEGRKRAGDHGRKSTGRLGSGGNPRGNPQNET